MNTASRKSESHLGEKHAYGIRLYSEGRFEEAAAVLQEALKDAATSEVANDWAAAELACGRGDEAENGFTRALALDSENTQAAANLGSLLASLGRVQEAIPVLQKAVAGVEEGQRKTIAQILAACRTRITVDALEQSRAALPNLIAELRQPRAASAPSVLRSPVYVGNNRALLCTTSECKMYVDTTDLLIAPWLLMHGEWEPEETAIFKRTIKPGDVFVDVGANIGYYTLLAVRCGASRVFSFEPQKSTYELLGKNVIINWMTSVVRYENLAVYSRSTELSFFARNAYPGNSSIGETAPEQLERWFDESEKVTVRAVSLDDYFADKPGKIDVLKIDVEGAEPAAFEGARRILEQNPGISIFCEWSPDQMATANQRPEQLVKFWKELGFRAFAVHTNLGEVSLDSLLKSGYQNLLLHR